MGCSRRTSNYLKRIELSNPTHMMSMIDLVATGVETPKRDSECCLEREFTALISVNP